MKKCCFIVPYYGRLPQQFPVFLKSCGANPDFHWLLLTDDRTAFSYPDNVQVVYNTLADFRALAEEKFGFPVQLGDGNAYKLCDMKPAYGFLLEEYISEFRFWGHCDIDTVMGKLGDFLTDELLEQYDKLFCLGHMTLFRNTPENNRVFMSEHNGHLLYKESFTTPEITVFDEEYHDNNCNQIFLHQGKRVYQKDLSLNISIEGRRFRRTEQIGRSLAPEAHGYRIEEYRPASYFWDHGKIIRMTEGPEGLRTESFLYIHLQYRKMEFSQAVLDSDVFRIVPNQFVAMRAIPGSRLGYRLTPKISFSTAPIRRRVQKLFGKSS